MVAVVCPAWRTERMAGYPEPEPLSSPEPGRVLRTCRLRLSRYVGDTIGHSRATNPSVAIEFPTFAKFRPSVNYAQARHPHGHVEFAFDIDQISKKRLPPAAYLRSIGLSVPRQQLATACYETYGSTSGRSSDC